MSRDLVARLAVAAADMARSLHSRDPDTIVAATDALETTVRDLKSLGAWHADDAAAAQLRGLVTLLAEAADRAETLTGATRRRAALIDSLRAHSGV